MNTYLVLVCLATLSAICVVDCAQKSHDVLVTSDIESFRKQHPELVLQPLKRIRSRGRSYTQVRYTLGARISGDKLIAQSSDVFSYTEPRAFTIKLTYPQEEGTGSTVTYVEIICDQGSKDGNAYVVSGGIGQSHIQIVLEAEQTEQFSYQAQFYGV